jgi:hypothetical protein
MVHNRRALGKRMHIAVALGIEFRGFGNFGKSGT